MQHRTVNAPKHGEYPCHTPDCQNLVLDDSSPHREIVVMWFGKFFVLELFFGARVENRDKHVGDCVKDASMRYGTTLIKEHTLFSDERQAPFEHIFKVWQPIRM